MRRLIGAIVLSVALATSAAPALAQTIHPVDLDGKIVNLVVPEGYCELDRSNPRHREIFEHYYGDDDSGIRVLGFFVECEGLSEFTTIADDLDRVADNGVYYTDLNPDGSVKTFPGMDRGEFVRMFAELLPELPLAVAKQSLREALEESGNPPMEISQSGLTDYDSDALYMSMIGTAELSSGRRIVGGSTASTFVHERFIFLGLSRLMENEDSIERLSDDARQLMADFLAANPNSD